MAEVPKTNARLEIAHVLFIDIVGYSARPTDEQQGLVNQLNQAVRSSDEFSRAAAAGRLRKIPTGDGMALIFQDSPEQPIECAVEISRVLDGDAGRSEPPAKFSQPKRDDRQSTASAPEKGKSQAGHFSICVLPFTNMSGEAEQEYFSDGISEDIITDLSNVSALHVVSRNTAFTFKGKSVDVRQVANQLNVSHVLEGSVRKAAGRVRINAQLIDGSNDSHVWAQRFDRDLNDIFAIQDEISRAIVEALRVKLLPEEEKAIERRGTNNADAYKLFLMARKSFVTGYEIDERRNDAIIRLCRRAVELDPDYAEAWALIAMAEMVMRASGVRGGDGGLAAAERALSINPNLAEALPLSGTLPRYGGAPK